MNDTRFPKSVYEEVPTGRRNVSRPTERWADQHPRRQKQPKMACISFLITLSKIVYQTLGAIIPSIYL
jgi:hypothetical protein